MPTQSNAWRWPIGRFTFKKRGGDGYAILSLIPAGKVSTPPISESTIEAGAANDPDPFDLFGTILYASVAVEGPRGTALYALCLVHGSTKEKLAELVTHHQVGIQTIHTVEASIQDDGSYTVESIKDVTGVKLIVGRNAQFCLGRVLGLSDFRLSNREVERVLGNHVRFPLAITTDLWLLANRLRYKVSPLIGPLFWVILGVLLDRLWTWADPPTP